MSSFLSWTTKVAEIKTLYETDVTLATSNYSQNVSISIARIGDFVLRHLRSDASSIPKIPSAMKITDGMAAVTPFEILT